MKRMGIGLAFAFASTVPPILAVGPADRAGLVRVDRLYAEFEPGRRFLVAGAPRGQAPVCEVVSESDAAAVIGSVEKKSSMLGPDQCVFTTKGMSLLIGRMQSQDPEAVQGMIQLPKQRARKGDVVQDEPGIGDAATSELSKGHAMIIAAQKDIVWTFTVDHTYNQDLSATLPKLRELAKKALTAKR
jgi:hypothetical protein